MNASTQYSHEHIARRIHSSRRAKRGDAVATVGLVTALLAVSLIVLALRIEWQHLLIAGVAMSLVAIVGIIVGSVIAARAVDIGAWRALRFAVSKAARGLCSIFKMWAGA